MDGPILFVEDNDDDAFFIMRSFSKAGLPAVHRLYDGASAIDYLSRKGPYQNLTETPVPRLALLDLRLPLLNGFEVVKWIRAHPAFNQTVVIVWSSSIVAEDMLRAYELGANCYLVKPTILNHYEQMVAGICGKWLKQNKQNESRPLPTPSEPEMAVITK